MITDTRFYGPALLPTSPTTLFTAGPGESTIQLVHVMNQSGSPADLTLSVGSDGVTTRLYDGLAFGSKEMRAIPSYIVLQEGDIVQGFSGSASALLLVISGQTYSDSDVISQITGTHWADANEYTTLAGIGYSFSITNVAPADLAGATARLDAAHAAGIKLIIGLYSFGGAHPYQYTNDQWILPPATITMLNLLQSREADILAFFGFNEPYWINTFTETSDANGAHSASQLRAFRDTIHTVWPTAKIYHDIGEPSQWAPGGSLWTQHPGIGNKYADQTGVADYVGIWGYPFKTTGYAKAAGLTILTTESSFVQSSMSPGITAFLAQSHEAIISDGLLYPTLAQITDWNQAIRAALPNNALITWYVWRQNSYSDYLANHPEQWAFTV